jgi:hypothetical protein
MSLEELPMNFKISLADRLRAAAGVPAYVRRKRRIEDLEEALLQALDELERDAQKENPDNPFGAQQAFLDAAEKLDLRLLNDLIERHNHYYPIEANLPCDLKTGEFLLLGQVWHPLPKASIDSFIQQFRALRSSSPR